VRLDLRLGLPVRGLCAVAAMAAATVAVLLATPLATGWRIALVLTVAADALWAGCAVLRTGALNLDRAGRIEVRTRDGRARGGRVLDGSFVAPWFIAVRWQPDGRRFSRTIALLPDMLSAQDLRHLRVLLKWA
jgi:hypothetical protein